MYLFLYIPIMGKLVVQIIGALGVVILLACNKKSDEPQPLINSFYPRIATKLDPIRIVGKHFLNTKQVYFGDAPALNFTIVSDTILFATINSGASGNIRIETKSGSITASGFTYYDPIIYQGIENSKFLVRSWPQLIPLDSTNVQVEGSIQILEVNKYDSLRNQFNSFGAFPSFAEDESYIRLQGLIKTHYDPRASITSSPFWRFGTNTGLVIYAKKNLNGFDIPLQSFEFPINGPTIQGTATIANGKLTLNYITEELGARRSATLISQ